MYSCIETKDNSSTWFNSDGSAGVGHKEEHREGHFWGKTWVGMEFTLSLVTPTMVSNLISHMGSIFGIFVVRVGPKQF